MSSPRWLRRLSRAFGALTRRGQAERELDDEMRFHLEMEAAELETRGLHPRAARQEARRRFGGVDLAKEECRDQRPGHRLEAVFQDVRYGLRTFRRNPGSFAAASLTLALGIGANAAVFSVVYAVLLQPLPYGGGDRLVVIRQHAPAAGMEDLGFSPPEIRDLQTQAQAFTDVVEYHRMFFTLLGGEEPKRVSTGVVSHQYFQTLGVEPRLGRFFLPDDEGPAAEPVLIVSHDLWMDELGGTEDVLGRSFEMNDKAHTVVGVLPPLPQHPHANDVYMPTSACPFRSNPQTAENRRARGYYTLGRVGDGVSLEQGLAQLQGLMIRMADAYPEDYPQGEAFQGEIEPLHQALTKDFRPALLLLLGTVCLVLLIACANVASLSLAQLSSRQRELALRRALGAGRGRLSRQLVTEGLLLGLAGGLFGILLAAGAVDLVATVADRFTVRAHEIRLSGAVMLFTLGLSIACGVALGLLATFKSFPRQGLRAPQAAGSQEGTALRRWLVLGQLAVSAVLLVGAGLTAKSLLNLQRVDPGFDPDGVLTAELALNWTRYDDGEKRATFFRRLLADLRSEPGVESAALGSTVPLNGDLRPRPLTIEGRAEEEGALQPLAQRRFVSDGYFETLGIPVLAGRTFRPSDDAEAPLAVILSQALARRHWPDGHPLGQRISFDGGDSWYTVIGVVGDVKQESLAEEAAPGLYVALAQNPILSADVLLRTRGRPLDWVRPTRQAVYGIDPEQPVVGFQTLAEVRSASTAEPRLMAAVLGLFAALALAITVTGLAGLLAFSVNQRIREIGVRMALGATPGGVRRMVLGQGLAVALGGLALGCAAGLAATRGLDRMLFGVEPYDPATFAAVAAVLLAAALAACWAPVRRATRVDPMSALRTD